MFTNAYLTGIVMLSKNMVQGEPGIIVGPIAKFLGLILNVIFNFVYSISPANSLGFSIIILTIFTRFLMLPLGFAQQKSMGNMQKIQPEVEKIRKKYPNKDTASQQKLNAEIQNLYRDHKVNPVMGCLPMFIQMPIFFALNYIMNHSYAFINTMGDLYYKLSDTITKSLNVIGIVDYEKLFRPLTEPKLPLNVMKKAIAFHKNDNYWDFAKNEILPKFLNKFTVGDWQTTVAGLPEDISKNVSDLLTQKSQIDLFFGIDLTQNPMAVTGGFANIMSHMWPGILIPILALATTYLSSYLMNKQSTAVDATAQSTQKMMLIVMPIMMGGMTATFPAGVGIYWITSTTFQIAQQFLLNKVFVKKTDTTVINVKPKK